MPVSVKSVTIMGVEDARHLNLMEIRGLIVSMRESLENEVPVVFYDLSALGTWSIRCDPEDKSLYYEVYDKEDLCYYTAHFVPLNGNLVVEILEGSRDDLGRVLARDSWTAENLEDMWDWGDDID